MERPFIFCHMRTSLDGKITGPFMQVPLGPETINWYYHEAFDPDGYYHPQGWLSGRKTTEDNFTDHRQPELDEDATVPAGDFVATDQAKQYYISIDTHGVIGWQQNYVDYKDTHAAILEILTENTSDAYKAFLRGLNISYIIAGKDKLDAPLAMQKLKTVFHMDVVMLGGGGILNWSFIKQGLCDELSLFITPMADGATDTPTLFEAVPGLSDTSPVNFTLENIEVKDSLIWARYKVDNAK